MVLGCARGLVRAGLALWLALPVLAGDQLTAAYADVLRGDVNAGLARVEKIRASGENTPEVTQVEGWLKNYQTVSSSRSSLNRDTFDWHVQHAKEELAKNDPAKLYLALTFSARAGDYAVDPAAFRKEPWVAELTQKCADAAKTFQEKGDLQRAHAVYLGLERIHGPDSPWVEKREAAGRHLRVEFLYADRAALDRRILDVDVPLLSAVLRQVSDNYYERPDFKVIAEGGLEYLSTLTESKKLRKYLDGLANADSRALFGKKLDELRKSIQSRESWSWRDVANLYEEIRRANLASVELPEGLMVVEFVEGGLSRLDDFTSMVWPADAIEFDKMMLGGFEGVGIQLGIDEETSRLKVVTPLENSPALEAGIQPDDLIDRVNGGSTKGWTTDDAVRNIMGPAGTVVTLTMYRPSTGERLDFDLKRRQIVLKTVRGAERVRGTRGDEWNYILDPAEKIAYLRLTGFHPDSDGELEEALKTAKAQGMRGLILDLRYNPGGLLDVAVDLVSEFVRKGEVVTTSGRRRDEHQRLEVGGRPAFADLPLVVLVNDSSASASEILAGALQYYDRGVVIGQRTYGKGSVQRVLPLNRTTARLKLTTALYYLPDGRSPHREPHADKWGVDADIELKLTLKEEREVITRQNKALIIRNGRDEPKQKVTLSENTLKELRDEQKKKAEDDEETDSQAPLLSAADIELLNSDPFKAAVTDPQLEMALLQLRVKLAGGLPWPAKMAAADNGKPGGG